jgi:methyltransferase (TIGR00027 family)
MAITHISDTARWVATYRAMETERPDAIFNDPFAERLAGEQGRKIVDAMPRGRQSAWAMITRTAVFDEIILDLVRGSGVDLVVNLAAGLDARPWRLDLSPRLRWVDVDLPDILRYKTETLKNDRTRCAYEAIHADLREPATRQALFAQLGASASRALIVTEGLLVYLTAEQVGALARDLHAQPSFRWWLIDLASPRLLAMLKKQWGDRLERGNSPMQFGPAEGTKFFEPFGWREEKFRSSLEEAQRLKREMPLMWLWRFMMKLSPEAKKQEFRRMSGIVLLQRT